jgi:CheY-like chemotaxis protein/two-component sensor histidine kinase
MKIEDAGKQVLDKIRQSMHALNEMLHGLLDISRLDSSTVENHPKHIALNEVIDQLLQEYAAKGDEKGVSVMADINAPITVYADTILLNRVLRNLLDNAVKYTREGQVVLRAIDTGAHISLTISDTGMGIPSDQQQNIFNEFYQLNNPERDRQKGLGLGLAIVRRLCDLMGITLRLSSEEGVGTTVDLQLPRGVEQEIYKPTPPASIDLDGLVVAIVDDEQDILDGMQTVLNGWGCVTFAATDYNHLYDILIEASVKPELIIADFRLRDKQNGIDAIELMREEFNQNIPAILATGDTAPDRVREANSADVEVLYKPIDADELRITIFEVLSNN